VDIDIDTSAEELLDKLAVREGEIPVVYCNKRLQSDRIYSDRLKALAENPF
jgi:hypothetical protein